MTNYVLQPPCCGAALALEAWAIGGESVRVERFGAHALAVAYDSVRWVYCAGVAPAPASRGVYPQTLDVLGQLRAALAQAGGSFERVVRTWFYLGGITEAEAGRPAIPGAEPGADGFLSGHPISTAPLPDPNAPRGVYPASTGIGMAGRGLVGSCLRLETRREDVFLLPLENPQQTPAYAYSAEVFVAEPEVLARGGAGAGGLRHDLGFGHRQHR